MQVPPFCGLPALIHHPQLPSVCGLPPQTDVASLAPEFGGTPPERNCRPRVALALCAWPTPVYTRPPFSGGMRREGCEGRVRGKGARAIGQRTTGFSWHGSLVSRASTLQATTLPSSVDTAATAPTSLCPGILRLCIGKGLFWAQRQALQANIAPFHSQVSVLASWSVALKESLIKH
jgi:hypothetical protein